MGYRRWADGIGHAMLDMVDIGKEEQLDKKGGKEYVR